MKICKKSYSYLPFLVFFIVVSMASQAVLAKEESQAFDSSIVVLAPTSMTNAMHEIVKMFSNENNISVSTTFEASEELSKLIEDGEPANIFLTEDSSKMIDLQRLGVLNVYSLAPVTSDSLVLVIPKGHFLKKKISKIKNINEKLKFIAKNFSLVIPDPETDPAGKFAKQAFDKIGVWDAVTQKMLKAVNTRNALYLIANGNNPGIIYNSDYTSNTGTEILLSIPENFYNKIIYQASIVGGLDSENANQDSEKFMDFLKRQRTQDIFVKYGFSRL